MASRHLGPIILRNGVHETPERILFGTAAESGKDREAFIQRLIFDHPQALPMTEIEPAFAGMRSVCMELPLPVGSLDNLWITPSGGIVLGECKLFRNPQARREVIAQALDYAQSLQGMAYEEFERRIGTARRDTRFRLWPFAIEGVADLGTIHEEHFFIDGVTRRLREGQFMVLVIGDGIHEGAETLADYLQLHAGIHANLALIDLSIWQLADGSRLVVPRLPLKTATVVRGVVKFADNGTTVSVVPEVVTDTGSASDRTRSAAARRLPTPARSGSEEEFFALAQQNDPDTARLIRDLCDTHRRAGGEIRFTPEYMNGEVRLGDRNVGLFSIKYNGNTDSGFNNLLAATAGTPNHGEYQRLVSELAATVGTRVGFTQGGLVRFELPNGRLTRIENFDGHMDAVGSIIARIVDLAANEAAGD